MIFNKKNKSINKTKDSLGTKSDFVLPQSLKFSLVLIQALNLLMLSAELSSWFIMLGCLCLLWQLAIHQEYVPQPSRFIKFFVSIVGCLLLIISAQDMGILLGMIHLLSLAYLLKPFEINARKDFYQLSTLGFFILATSFIFIHSIYFTVVVFALIILNFAWLFSYFTTQKSIPVKINTSLKLLLQSLPLAVVLFVFFPKIAPFWHVPMANSAKTGLSDNVSIGDISSLVLSNELAFRVEFSDQAPTYSEMYWRAIVLDTFDGTTWRRTSKTKQNIVKSTKLNQQLDLTNTQLSYQVIAEPSYQRWLFALDVARLDGVKQNKIIHQLTDQTLISREKITQPISYEVTSFINNPMEPSLSSSGQHNNLLIDKNSNPKLFLLAKKLKRDFADHQSIIQHVLTNFRTEKYRYTLNPPALNNNSLDEFYFETQAGFCEHYASSFTFLMRAAGIPARMVLGYLGGEYNVKGNYYSVYQRDAHAWSEVWIPDVGWIRVDPTSAVDPSRVEQGFSQQLLSEKESLSAYFDISRYLSVAWVNQLLLQFEALDYQWTKLVINFSQEKQKQLLNDWFGDDFDYVAVAIVFISMFLMVIIFWVLHWFTKSKTRLPKWGYYYQETHKKLKKLGLNKGHEQLQKDYINKINQVDAQLGSFYQKLVTNFENIQYQENSHSRTLQLTQKMKMQYKQFSDRIKEIDV
jgi:protein-glutamine gamma-glutamyltransferase